MQALIDTNVLVYRYDGRFPAKQRIAERILRDAADLLYHCLAHQNVVEFVAAVLRPRADLGGRGLLEPREAYREAEEILSQFTVLYPTEEVLTTALRGAALYGFSWFDAHLWAYAETYGIPELYSEDFQHGRLYGGVRVVDPFQELNEMVNEPVVSYG